MRKRNQDPNEKARDMHVYPICKTRLNDVFLAICSHISLFPFLFLFKNKNSHTRHTHTHKSRD